MWRESLTVSIQYKTRLIYWLESPFILSYSKNSHWSYETAITVALLLTSPQCCWCSAGICNLLHMVEEVPFVFLPEKILQCALLYVGFTWLWLNNAHLSTSTCSFSQCSWSLCHVWKLFALPSNFRYLLLAHLTRVFPISERSSELFTTRKGNKAISRQTHKCF